MALTVGLSIVVGIIAYSVSIRSMPPTQISPSCERLWVLWSDINSLLCSC